MHYHKFTNKIFLIGAFILMCNHVRSQSSNNDIINEYKNGAAVVRLYVNKPKSDLLSKSIAQAESKEEKSTLQKMLDQHVADRNIYKKKVIKAFIEKYIL
jgi:hypothetical protein